MPKLTEQQLAKRTESMAVSAEQVGDLREAEQLYWRASRRWYEIGRIVAADAAKSAAQRIAEKRSAIERQRLESHREARGRRERESRRHDA